MPEIIRYRVKRYPIIDESSLEAELDAMGAGRWKLCGISYEPDRNQANPYLCVFRRTEEVEMP